MAMSILGFVTMGYAVRAAEVVASKPSLVVGDGRPK